MKTAIPTDLKLVNKEAIDKILTHLSENGTTNDLRPLLDLMVHTPHKDVLTSCVKFWADIKIKAAKQLIITAITDKKYASIQKEMVSVCWQSSIDFSENVNVFVDLLISSDFETAFEAFTVIENLTGKIEEDVIKKEQQKLKDAIPSAHEHLKGMLHEAIHLLENQNRQIITEV